MLTDVQALKIKTQEELLDPAKRSKIMEAIRSDENKRRKGEAFKAYECLKDRTNLYVYELLRRQFDETTVVEMQYAVSNVSIMRKVIDKLARVYCNGVKRELKKKGETKAIDDLSKYFNMDMTMRKVNRYYKAFRNTLVYVKPVKRQGAEGADVYEPQIVAMPPFLYDVIPDPSDPTRPLAVILSDYKAQRNLTLFAIDSSKAGRTMMQVAPVNALQRPGDGQPSPIADEPFDTESGQVIWWTKDLHFTTDGNGKIMPEASPDGNENVIHELPFVNFAQDQDGDFWAIGGGDISDTAIKLNTIITHMLHIAVCQGYGQLYMTGKNLPKSVKVGPNTAIQIEHEKDDPDPTVGYLESNPPLGDLKETVEMIVALLLSTNNLSTTGIQTSLSGGGVDIASGVAMMIDKSESIEDVEDQQQIFLDNEPAIWALVLKWCQFYEEKDLLIEDLVEIKNKPDDVKGMALEFGEPQPVLSEKEKLEAMKMRYEMGLNTMVELVMQDRPGISEEDAKKKLLEILLEKAARMVAMGLPQDQNNSSEDPNGGANDPGNGGGGKQPGDNLNPGDPSKAPSGKASGA